MSREIKFRAWDVEAEAFIVPFDVMVNGMGTILEKEPNTIVSTYFPSSREIVIQQFTGLRDKNGKEIYEGDLVRVQSQYETDEPIDSSPNKVYFRDGSFRCGFHDMILNEKVCSGITGNWNMEVVGNEHENSELLK